MSNKKINLMAAATAGVASLLSLALMLSYFPGHLGQWGQSAAVASVGGKNCVVLNGYKPENIAMLSAKGPEAACYEIQGATSLSNAVLDQHSDRLREALKLSAESGKILFISGYFKVGSGLALLSNARLHGVDANATISFEGTVASGIVVTRKANGAEIRKVTLLERGEITAAMIILLGDNVDITIDEVTLKGKNVGTGAAISGILLSQDGAENIAIRNSNFNNLEYGVHTLANVDNLQINHNTFERWTHYAIRIYNREVGARGRIKDVQISNNTFENPAVGPFRSVILVTRGVSRAYANDVTITYNTITGPGLPHTAGDTTTNATGDQIVIHGVNGFIISHNTVTGGGENGISAARLSRNGTIANNVVYSNDTHGINIGSGYYEVTVDDPSEFSVGDKIKGDVSGTTATIEAMYNNVLMLTGVGGGSIFRDEPITNLTTGVAAASDSYLTDRTKYINVVDNTIYDNGLDLNNNTPVTAGVYITNSDSIELRRNKIYNSNFPASLTNNLIHLGQKPSVLISNSRNILVDDSNVFEKGLRTAAQSVTLNASSWLRK